MVVIVITGASGGIGASTAKALGRRGHAVVLAARHFDPLNEVATAIGASTRTLVVPIDVTKAGELRHLADTAGNHFGGIDVWINCAGRVPGRGIPVWSLAEETLNEVMSVNLLAPLISVGVALPWLVRSPSGHFINVGSLGGFIGANVLYSATKFGLRGATEALRRELAGQGISVSLVTPGYIDTAMTRSSGFKGRMAAPEMVADRIVKLVEHGSARNAVVPAKWRLAIWLNVFFPGLMDRLYNRPRRSRLSPSASLKR